ncbi:MAG: AsnC family protein [Magnetococcales bacterium]|nr:AsnC family protein [Magnetococcales bacterium]
MLNEKEASLLEAIQAGFPLTPRPFQDIGIAIGQSESEVIATLQNLNERGVIKRMGVVVRHRELGFKANAMVVWNVPDHLVSQKGKLIGEMDFVNLCYLRSRALPRWPYNLYCMIHGRQRSEVLDNIAKLEAHCAMGSLAKEVLFSQRRFKQHGAHYFKSKSTRTNANK